MRQSNTYIIIFSAVLTIILGGMLSFASVGLKPAQQKQIELDTKGQILGAVMDLKEGDDVLAIYDRRIKSMVVDINGKEVTTNRKGEPVKAEQVDVAKEYKVAPEERFYPVYEFTSKEDTTKVEAYIFPVYGNGLWDKIWGFIALASDFNTIKGAAFAHKAETPGLGARIATPEVQKRFAGKKIYDDKGNLVSVTMVKGEGHSDLTDHQVDGMSGASMTGKGLNNMLMSYLKDYQEFIKKSKEGKSVSLLK